MFYIVLIAWLYTLVFSAYQGNKKLPSLSLGFGTVTVWLIHSRGNDLIGVSILAALAAIVYCGSKLNRVNSAG